MVFCQNVNGFSWTVVEQLLLFNAKVWYKIDDMWKQAETVSEAVGELYNKAEHFAVASYRMINDSIEDAHRISRYLPLIEENNPSLLDSFTNILKN